MAASTNWPAASSIQRFPDAAAWEPTAVLGRPGGCLRVYPDLVAFGRAALVSALGGDGYDAPLVRTRSRAGCPGRWRCGQRAAPSPPGVRAR